jgi:hypothetical protein
LVAVFAPKISQRFFEASLRFARQRRFGGHPPRASARARENFQSKSVPLVIVVNPSVPAKTIPEFIALAKANQGKISMASGGNGSTPHVAGELFKMMAGIDMVHVPYRGARQGGPGGRGDVRAD